MLPLWALFKDIGKSRPLSVLLPHPFTTPPSSITCLLSPKLFFLSEKLPVFRLRIPYRQLRKLIKTMK